MEAVKMELDIHITLQFKLVMQIMVVSFITFDTAYNSSIWLQLFSGYFLGQFYVMMSPQDVIPVTGAGQRIIAPRAQTLATYVNFNTFAH